MSSKSSAQQSAGQRAELLKELAAAGRSHSDATVILHSKVAAFLGLNPTGYKTMSLLERQGPMSAGEISKSIGLTSASVTELLDRLEKKNFVRRVHDRNDRRRIIIEPVAHQIDSAKHLFSSTGRSLERLLKSYSEVELATIADFLQRDALRLRSEVESLEKKQPWHSAV
jgi:DNA-binding MarR family transcriptional regulator